MKCFFMVASVVLTLVGTVSARLGETPDECVQRYGPVVEKREAGTKESDSGAMVFSKSSITVIVEFREGRAWRITFRKVGLSVGEVDAILSVNAGEGVWSLPLRTRDREFRMNADKSRVAVVNWDRRGIASSMSVMTRDYTLANRTAMQDRAVESGSDGSQAGKAAVNPLPGF